VGNVVAGNQMSKMKLREEKSGGEWAWWMGGGPLLPRNWQLKTACKVGQRFLKNEVDAPYWWIDWEIRGGSLG